MELIQCNSDFRFGSNMYVLYSKNEAAVIDPSLDYQSFCSRYGNREFKFKYIIITHAHFDHILEIDSWVECSGAKVIIGIEDAPALKDSKLNYYKAFLNWDRGYYGDYIAVSDGTELVLDEEAIKVISTPGHSKGSISLYCDGMLFVGDVVFAGGMYGRTDFYGSDTRVLFESVEKLCQFQDEITVFPGHGESTTIKEIKAYRGYL